MSLYIDKKFMALLAPKLQQYKKLGEFLWNFRCPVCGDSQKNKLKARGYIYKRKDTMSFMCHNCSASMSFVNFLKYVDPHLYKEYLLEKFKKPEREREVDVSQFISKPVFVTKKKIDLPTIESLPDMHPAKVFLTNRNIPKERLSQLYYAEDFGSFMKELLPENEKALRKEPRIIIPFYDREGNLLGLQGRALGDSKVKYITMKMDDEATKLFGWDKLDTTKRVYVVEGPIDSMFLVNCVATMDASLYHAPSTVGLDCDYTFVYDNEPRNTQIVSNIRKTISQGREVCIWPDTIKAKDVNEMVQSGLSPAAIQHIIDNNTFSGLEATMRLNQWSKV